MPLSLPELRERIPQVGRVTWIGVRPARREPMHVLAQVTAEAGRGLAGDRRMLSAPDSDRQVTLFQEEHLAVVGSLLGGSAIDPSIVRRNIVIAGINLAGCKEHRLQLGDAVLEITGPCHPCSRMEEVLGEGGYQAMRGHGGWCARIIESGDVRVGDQASAAPAPKEPT